MINRYTLSTVCMRDHNLQRALRKRLVGLRDMRSFSRQVASLLLAAVVAVPLLSVAARPALLAARTPRVQPFHHPSEQTSLAGDPGPGGGRYLVLSARSTMRAGMPSTMGYRRAQTVQIRCKCSKRKLLWQAGQARPATTEESNLIEASSSSDIAGL
jgi:hypothetical protein